MSKFGEFLFCVSAILCLLFGIVGLVKPDLLWKWRIGRDTDSEPHFPFLLYTRIGAVFAIFIAVMLFIEVGKA